MLLLSGNAKAGIREGVTYDLFTQQVQAVRVTEVFFGVKHLQEEDKNSNDIMYVYSCSGNRGVL